MVLYVAPFKIKESSRHFWRLLALVLLGSVGTLPLYARETSPDENLSGTYVLYQQTTTITELPVIKNYIAQTRAVSLQRLRHLGVRLEGEGDLCSVEIVGSSDVVRTELPIAFRRALPPVRTEGILRPSASGWLFEQPEQIVVLGARLADPRKEALPDGLRDRRIFDQDKDGHPGVTVLVHGLISGEVYVTQRSSSRLSGRQTADGFAGRIHFRTEQRILDASSSFLKNQLPQTPAPEQSFFRMKKVDAKTSCAEAQRLAQAWQTPP